MATAEQLPNEASQELFPEKVLQAASRLAIKRSSNGNEALDDIIAMHSGRIIPALETVRNISVQNGQVEPSDDDLIGDDDLSW